MNGLPQIETITLPTIGTPVYWTDEETGRTRVHHLVRISVSGCGVIFTDDHGASFTDSEAREGSLVSFAQDYVG